MRNPGGYAVFIMPGEAPAECDTFTCGHCNSIVHVKPKCDPSEVGGLCKVCMKMICPACLSKGCTPFEKKLEEMESREIARRSYGL